MKWLKYRVEQPDAAARLFCLPFAGGTALTYRPWIAFAPPGLEICPVQLPGRDERRGEPMYRTMSSLVMDLASAISPYLDLPFGLFGHSMGARVAFELARELRERGAPCPAHLFVSGSRAPHIPSRGPDLHRMDNAALIEALRGMQGTPGDILDDESIMAGLLPVIRADFEVLETYSFDGAARLDCDITAFRGAADPCATRDETEAWGGLTSERFALKTYPGNHFFIVPQGRAVLAETGARLFRSLPAEAA